jgi:hypothetical protein
MYGWGQNDIVNQTVIFMQLMYNYYPDVQFTSVEAYAYNQASLLNWWMAAVKNASMAAGIPGPNGFELDHDPNTVWSWADITIDEESGSLTWLDFQLHLHRCQMRPVRLLHRRSDLVQRSCWARRRAPSQWNSP